MRARCCGRWASAEKPISARDGRWFTVRIMPYRTLDDRIDGVVITFADITVRQKAGTRVAGEASRSGKAHRGPIFRDGQGPGGPEG